MLESQREAQQQLLKEFADKEFDTQTLAKRIIHQICQAITLEQHTVQIGISISISIYPDHTEDLDGLQTQADRALYKSKNNGRNTFSIFS